MAIAVVRREPIADALVTPVFHSYVRTRDSCSPRVDSMS